MQDGVERLDQLNVMLPGFVGNGAGFQSRFGPVAHFLKFASHIMPRVATMLRNARTRESVPVGRRRP